MPLTLKAWQEVQALLPPLSTSEERALSDSIAADGVKMPVLHLPDGRIIDGHHRWKLSDGSAPTQALDIPEERAFALAIALNAARRQMSDEQLGALQEKLRKDKQLQRDTALQLRQQGVTQEKVAATVGVPQQTLSDWENKAGNNTEIGNVSKPKDLRVSIPKERQPEIVRRHAKGEAIERIASDFKVTPKRISQIVRQVERRPRTPRGVESPVPLPAKVYRCLVIDPPWPMKKIEREERPNQGKALDYPVMSLEEIEALPIKKLADPDGCHVYLWVTHKYLPAGLKLFEAWGVHYQCVMTWAKNVGFTPFSWMYDTEHVLFGRIGSLDLEKMGMRLWFEAKVTRHSAKPDVFFERVAKASPEPRLEMFSREVRDGFEPWGNEAPPVSTHVAS